MDGIKRPHFPLEKSRGYTLHKLPVDYTTIRSFILKIKYVYVAR